MLEDLHILNTDELRKIAEENHARGEAKAMAKVRAALTEMRRPSSGEYLTIPRSQAIQAADWLEERLTLEGSDDD